MTTTPSNPDDSTVPAQAVSAVEQADVQLGLKLAAHRKHPLVRAAAYASKLIDQEPLYALGGVMLLAGIAARQRKLGRTGVAVLAGVGLADLAKSGIKRTVHRTRPHVVLDGGQYDAGVGGVSEKPKQSFPSGHFAGGMAASLAVGRHYPRTGVLSYAVTTLLGISRVAKGAHWPLDLAAGVGIGALSGTVANGVLDLVDPPPERFSINGWRVI